MEEVVGLLKDEAQCDTMPLEWMKSAANITINLTADALLRVSIPVGPNQKPEQCRRFRQTQWQLLDSNLPAMNNTELETEPCLDGWTYDQSVFTSTIVTETISIAGNLLGTVNGILSDRFGRKPLLVICFLVYGILGICYAFAPIFSLYCILRFLMSACVSAIYSKSIVLLLEGTSSKWHPAFVTATGLSWSAGLELLGVLTYAIRDWHMLQLALALPFFTIALFTCWISELVHWLVTTGKTECALGELQKIG
ncbi:solute carrier family 22 member 22-like [Castor canadensis]|uniref:Solute carrier family 22 member 22-like n=1 Tax=Castor canadensis TaxID=51338 RepID=A0AC58M114_CASCN